MSLSWMWTPSLVRRHVKLTVLFGIGCSSRLRSLRAAQMSQSSPAFFNSDSASLHCETRRFTMLTLGLSGHLICACSAGDSRPLVMRRFSICAFLLSHSFRFSNWSFRFSSSNSVYTWHMTAGVSVRSVSLVSFAFSLVKLKLSVLPSASSSTSSSSSILMIFIWVLLFIMRLDNFISNRFSLQYYTEYWVYIYILGTYINKNNNICNNYNNNYKNYK